MNNESLLEKYGENFTKKTYVSNPAIGRDNEIKELVMTLLTPEKSGVLVGKPGIGKTAIVEGLGWRIQRGEVPDALKKYSIYKINTASLLGVMPGTNEPKIQMLLNEIKGRDDLILFIDEIHTLMGTGDESLDFANIFKPGLDRGTIKVIGATTTEEYETYILRDKAFMRRFDKSFRRAKEMLDSGAIGKVTMVKSNTYGPSQPQEWMYDVRKSYGPLGEVNSHDFDTLRWYAGSEVKAVYSIGHNFRSPEKASEYPEWYDTCVTTLEFENGIIRIITGAQYVKYGYDSRAEILGTEGIIKTGSQDTNTAEMVTSNREIHKDSMDSWRTLFKDAYAAEDQAFVNCILNDTEPEVTGHDGMMALVLVNESLRSLLEHKRIEL
mgnify:CR=1 FL=1